MKELCCTYKYCFSVKKLNATYIVMQAFFNYVFGFIIFFLYSISIYRYAINLWYTNIVNAAKNAMAKMIISLLPDAAINVTKKYPTPAVIRTKYTKYFIKASL